MGWKTYFPVGMMGYMRRPAGLEPSMAKRQTCDARADGKAALPLGLIWLAVGAVLGALSRYFLGTWLNTAGFPYGTMWVNVTGCLIIGFFGTLVSERITVDPNLRLAIQVGFLGSYTTFSSFGYETLRLLDAGHGGRALLNLLGNNGLGLGAVWLGMLAARALPVAQVGPMAR